ncbi:MAG: saccharopine dehydrogenase NADP-binding domain-containing protein [Thermoplasmata archaeon]|nr:MAG: saccharopine dehydrogenase NADP-binding domain-containing protein [Thermoplasmata archaeon]
MSGILVLGAGMVAGPLVRYLLDQDFEVKVASRTISKAEKLVEGYPKGSAESLDVEKPDAEKKLEELISSSDLAVSLLPYIHHVMVAKLCIKHKKNMVTTSYVSDAMRALDEDAKKAGIIIINESGVDPGIDHMSAMRIIHKVEEEGGKVISFKSTTGALPAQESNNNPFGYKFSWAPKGVLLASRNAAKWLEDGKEVSIPGEQLFENYYIQDVPSVGAFENYPNRNSIPYKEVYGLSDAKTVYRGTFRNVGWCETLRCIVALGWLADEPVENFTGGTYGELTGKLIGAGSSDNIVNDVAAFLGLKPYSAAIKRLNWLGLFSDEPLPADKNNPLDYLNVLTLKKMSMDKKDKDMIVMLHEFVAEFPDKKEYITSTLLDYGIPGGDTSVARTVGLPAAIAVKMVLQGKIDLIGVHIPTKPEIYNPILDELEEIGIRFLENRIPI